MDTTIPRDIRLAAREGWNLPTEGLAPGYVQANLVILPVKYALDFLIFCQRNPRPCPVIEVTGAGSWEPRLTTPGADLRTDLPAYRVFERGILSGEVQDIRPVWRDDFMAFLIGCSYTFDYCLVDGGVDVPHITSGVTMRSFTTNIRCVSSGPFHGPMVASMRPILARQVSRAVQITARYPLAHGSPVHIGDPSLIGVHFSPEEWREQGGSEDRVPVFWGCGVTPQAVALEAKPEIMITHKSSYMFVTDLTVRSIEAV